MKKKFLASFLAMGLALTGFPVSASAAEEITENTEASIVVEEVTENAEASTVVEDTTENAEASIIEETTEENNETDEKENVDVDDTKTTETKEETNSIQASKVSIFDEAFYYVINNEEITKDTVITLEDSEDETIEVSFSDFTQIDSSDIYYYTTYSTTGKLYGTTEITYKDLYIGQTSSDDYDAVSSATTGKSGLFTSTNVSEVTEDGYYIYGLKNANVSISKEDYVKALILDEAGEHISDNAKGLLNVTLNEDNTIPSYYLPYDGKDFGKTVIRKNISINDAEGTLKYHTRYGTYMLSVNEVSTNYLRKTRDNDIYEINNSVHGAIIRGKDAEGNSISLGLRHLKEIWVSPYELAFSPDTNSKVSFEGGYITSVDYLTASNVYTYRFETPVKVKKTFDSSDLKIFFNSKNKKQLTISNITKELKDTALTISYKEGRTTTTIVDSEPVEVKNGSIKYTISEELLADKTYTVTITNDEYADIVLTVTPDTFDSDSSAEPEAPADPSSPVTPIEPVESDTPSTPVEPETPAQTEVPSIPETPTESDDNTVEEPSVPESPSETQKEIVNKIDQTIRQVVDNVIVPTIQKYCPKATNILPTVVSQLQKIQTKVIKYFFGWF